MKNKNKGKSPTSTRTLWKGSISFGLVHIPIGLYSATSSTDIDFDWLDKRSMEPVGYKRINKVTGKEIANTDIVKGVEYDDGQYVVLSREEIAAAFPQMNQTIEIEAFIDADELPLMYLERPYFTAPLKRGEKVYALLREALRKSNKAGVAKVVIHTKQHLAILIPCGRALVLNLLRWGGEIRSFEQLDLPPAGVKEAGIKEAELKMAVELIDDMTQPWNADDFRNSFAEEIHKLIEEKAESGEVAEVAQVEGGQPQPASADVIDLTSLLKRSLGGDTASAAGKKASKGTARKSAAKTTAKKASKKTSRRRA